MKGLFMSSGAVLPITGTFLDEITYDIPAQNWGRREWAREFDIFADIGIDTVIIIRAGFGRRGAFPSQVIGNPDDPDLGVGRLGGLRGDRAVPMTVDPRRVSGRPGSTP